MTLTGDKWTEGELERRGLGPPDVERAMRLLKLRDEIKAQAQKVTSAVSARRQNQENLAKYSDVEQSRTFLTETIHENERTVKVGTETVRGLVADLKKLADEIDPPKETAETLEAEYKKVLAEYDALLLRLVNTRVGRVLAIVDEALRGADSELKDAGVADADLPTARKLHSLRSKILAQKRDADEHVSRLHMKNNAIVPADELGLKFRTGALRGLVDDLKKVADELDPPGKKAGPENKEPGKQ
jgi:chromosome segregation ATPase